MLFELIGLGIFLWLLYKICIDPYNYWERKGFPYIKGSFPIGSKSTLSFFRRFQGHVLEEYYNYLSPHPYGGFYMFRRPHLLLRDPEIIKHIMAKDFSNFRSRFGKRGSKKDPLSQHLFNLEGDLWKSVRVKLTPTFTSGKLKMMYNLFEICGDQFSKVMISEQEKNGEVEIKEVVSRFTTDIIATCAFGLEVDSINNPDSEFRKIGQDIFPPFIRFKRMCLVILYSLFPFLESLYTFRGLPVRIEKFLLKVIDDTINYRETNKVERNDFLNLLLEIRNKGEHAQQMDVKPLEMDLTMITAQCFIFFAAGFETSSSVQSYALYEMALHQNLQDKVRKEIKTVLAKHGGKANYQALQEMPYLEQVIYETMRKYPTLPLITRECTKNYKTSDLGLDIEAGTTIYIPVYALHHDPKYFPDPDNFDPDRFSEENKSSIPQYAYLPFGEGPRICIGNRFGLLQTKLGLVSVLSNLKVLPSPRTQIPLEFVATMVVATVGDPIFLKLEKLTDE